MYRLQDWGGGGGGGAEAKPEPVHIYIYFCNDKANILDYVTKPLLS